MHIATLIAADGLDRAGLDEAAHQVGLAGGRVTGVAWLDAGEAGDVAFAWPDDRRLEPKSLAAALTAVAPRLDVVVQPAAGRAKRLLVADMDSTMITVECIDELADYAGLKAEVAAVTEQAMRGELDFAAALAARVSLLAGLDEGVLERCRRERVRAMPGAAALVATMRAHGARTFLVSGGFTTFAGPVAAGLGFDRAIANRLDLVGGRLSGTVALPIVGADTKRAVLEEERAALGLLAAETLAVGDGANDIPMLAAAGLGVAYRAKPRTAAAAAARIDHADLHALLWAQGYPRATWVGGTGA